MNCIDAKVSVWIRYHFTEEANMDGIKDIIEESGLEPVIDSSLGYIGVVAINASERHLEPIDNEGFSTMVIFRNTQKVWENGKPNE